jgi:Domain of unknown function (DUF4365)
MEAVRKAALSELARTARHRSPTGTAMTDEHRMEQLSRAYVQAVAAVAGCSCARPEPDYGCDLTIRQVVRLGTSFRPIGRNLDLQLRSTTTATRTDTEVVYDLDVRTYDLLRTATHAAPLLLVLYVLPPDPSEWLAQTDDQLALKHCAYWLSLRREPAVSNRSSVRVRVPRENRFTPEALLRIMKAVHKQESV